MLLVRTTCMLAHTSTYVALPYTRPVVALEDTPPVPVVLYNSCVFFPRKSSVANTVQRFGWVMEVWDLCLRIPVAPTGLNACSHPSSTYQLASHSNFVTYNQLPLKTPHCLFSVYVKPLVSLLQLAPSSTGKDLVQV